MTLWAAHPLITDDTGTQGTGKFQIEVNGQYDSDKETEAGVDVKATAGEVAAILSCGVRDTLDLVMGYPYRWITVKEDGATLYDGSGGGDVTLEVKWRFYENKDTSIALKPGVSLPFGDEQKGFGTGKTGYSAFLILTHKMESWTHHVNLGYIRNENKIDEEKDVWHASVATEYEAAKNLRGVANVGMEKNPDKTGDKDLAFALVGLIYGMNEDFDLDFGVKKGLTGPETDYSILAGLAVRF